PFVVRTLQPVLENLDAEVEEAAGMLGASRGQTFLRVIWPAILPSIVTGFALSFARALGEYGSVVFVSSNIPGKTEIAAVLLVNVPVVSGFVGAVADGVGAYLRNLTERDTLAAVRLTLVVAPAAVLLNLLFGVAAAWTIARFRFPGRTALVTLIDLPFSVSP